MSTLLEKSPRTSPARISDFLRPIATLLTVAICTLVFAATSMGILASLLPQNAAGSRDFIQYWAAGRQLIHHSNPYDEHAILPMERDAGYPIRLPAFLMPNPPTALPLVGLLGPKSAELFWLALAVACLIASVKMIRRMHGDPKNPIHWLGNSFAPALFTLSTVQCSWT